MQDLKKEIEQIKKRNARVEMDKAWETSRARKIGIAVLTYAVIILFFLSMKLPNPWINAIVPTIGFLLSTVSLGVFKTLWIKNRGTRTK